jgi:hypothetical protein
MAKHYRSRTADGLIQFKANLQTVANQRILFDPDTDQIYVAKAQSPITYTKAIQSDIINIGKSGQGKPLIGLNGNKLQGRLGTKLSEMIGQRGLDYYSITDVLDVTEEASALRPLSDLNARLYSKNTNGVRETTGDVISDIEKCVTGIFLLAAKALPHAQSHQAAGKTFVFNPCIPLLMLGADALFGSLESGNGEYISRLRHIQKCLCSPVWATAAGTYRYPGIAVDMRGSCIMNPTVVQATNYYDISGGMRLTGRGVDVLNPHQRAAIADMCGLLRVACRY